MLLTVQLSMKPNWFALTEENSNFTLEELSDVIIKDLHENIGAFNGITVYQLY